MAAINQAGYFDVTIDGHEKNIVLKVARGSQYPSDDFLSELTAAIQALVAADNIGSQMVLLDEDDYDEAYGDKGYINAQAAQNILSTQLAGMTSSSWRRSTTWTTGSTRWSSSWTAWSTSMR